MLERFIEKFAGLALILPVLNGIAGNMASIYTSRFSTFLYLRNSAESFNHSQIKRTLLILNIPIQSVFLFFMGTFHLGHSKVTFLFVVSYFCICNLQV